MQRRPEAKHCSSLCSQSEGDEYCGGQARAKIPTKSWPDALAMFATCSWPSLCEQSELQCWRRNRRLYEPAQFSAARALPLNFNFIWILNILPFRGLRCANMQRKPEAKHCSSLCLQSEGDEYCGGQARAENPTKLCPDALAMFATCSWPSLCEQSELQCWRRNRRMCGPAQFSAARALPLNFNFIWILNTLPFRGLRCTNMQRRPEAKHCSSLCSQSEGDEYYGGQARAKIPTKSWSIALVMFATCSWPSLCSQSELQCWRRNRRLCEPAQFSAARALPLTFNFSRNALQTIDSRPLVMLLAAASNAACGRE